MTRIGLVQMAGRNVGRSASRTPGASRTRPKGWRVSRALPRYRYLGGINTTTWKSLS